MFRKRRNPTSAFRIPPPYNPITGQHESLKYDGISPYCALMQIAEEDEYDDYVICRGFDPRIQKFIDYEKNNIDKPGISVAKPYGRRRQGEYRIGEIYPALLPIQGTMTYTPPTPIGVNLRLGQNPGVVDGATEDGHPQSLGDSLELLKDHNDVFICWLLIDTSRLEDIFYSFVLLGDLGSGQALAQIYKFDSGSIGGTVGTAIVHDPLKIFEELESGNTGICFNQSNYLYVIQAACPDDQNDTDPI